MIAKCPVCEGLTFAQIYQQEYAPIFQLAPPNVAVSADSFGRLELVRCLSCFHIYNRAFDSDLVDRMYQGYTLTNVPVNITISKSLEELASWIGTSAYAKGGVVEIGGGSGHLARILARDAESVLVFEPSAALTPDALPEENISLINAAFDLTLVDNLPNLMVCRQVLEHVPNPLQLLLQIRETLAPNGRLYLEVPRAEFIEEHAALYDLHYSHVQYFHEPNLLALARRAGFALDRLWRPIGGHDIGLMLRPGYQVTESGGSEGPEVSDDLGERLAQRRNDGAELMAGFSGTLALYGAAWHGVSFLNAYDTDKSFSLALDDNPCFAGNYLYSSSQRLMVDAPGRESLGEIDGVMITAYLHQQAISGRLHSLGFTSAVMVAYPELDTTHGG